MPEQNKNSPSSGLKNLLIDMLRGLPSPATGLGLGGMLPLQGILPMLLARTLLQKKALTPTEQPTPRPDLFPPRDPYAKRGQKYAFGATIPETSLDEPGYSAVTLGAADRPEGTRFYAGRGFDPNVEERAFDLSELDLERKILSTPADSITTARAKKSLPPDLFRLMLENLKNNPEYLRKQQGL